MDDYILLEDFTTENAGFSRWTIAKKNGEEYFLKEFLDPKFPYTNPHDPSSKEELSISLKTNMIRMCQEFEAKKKEVYSIINQASDGNVVCIEEFFRHKSRYYIATKKVEDSHITPKDMQDKPLQDRILLCLTVAHSMKELHKAHIVHSDIKPNNVLITVNSKGKMVGKIIDLDGSFLETKPPKIGEDLVGDQIYFSPEAWMFCNEEEVKIGCKTDVFALGLLFHQYLTGELPEYNKEEYIYPGVAILNKEELVLKNISNTALEDIIQKMLCSEAEKRPDMEKVFQVFKDEYLNMQSVLSGRHHTGNGPWIRPTNI